MTETTERPKRLLDDELVQLVDLMSGADSVELKLTVPETAQRSVIASLGVDPLDAQIRQVYFFDTPDLALNRAGVVARARRVQAKGDDTVVKLRPVTPDTIPPEFRQSPNLVVEVDAMPNGFVCSGSMKSKPANADVRQTIQDGLPIRKLFSKEQRAWFTAHAPEGIQLDDLAVLGPTFCLKVNFIPATFGRKLVGELWLYPDGSRILELSTKSLPGEALSVAASLRKFLNERGIESSDQQQTKTKTALEFYAAQLAAGPDR
jgi:hypothetical protein